MDNVIVQGPRGQLGLETFMASCCKEDPLPQSSAETVSLWIPGCPQTCHPPVSAPSVLRLCVPGDLKDKCLKEKGER